LDQRLGWRSLADCSRRRCHNTTSQRRRRSEGGTGEFADLLRRDPGPFGEFAHFVGEHGEALAVLVGAGGFDGFLDGATAFDRLPCMEIMFP
jgi:hypothetical protein